MKHPEAVEVGTIAALLERMKTGVFHVEWRVLPEIGPEWIGSRREIRFALDGVPLGDSEHLDALTASLVAALDLPATSADLLIRGEGEIARVGDALELRYEWTAAAPYEYPRDGGHGRVVLCRVP